MSKKVSSAAGREKAQKKSLEIPPENCFLYCLLA